MKMKIGKDKIKNQKGIALVEVIAALGVSAIAITALVSLSISTLRTSLNSKLLLEGTKIANREIELVRAFRDGEDPDEGGPRSWKKFISDVVGCVESNPCYINDSDISVFPGSKYRDEDTPEEIKWSFVVSDPINNDPVGETDNIVRVSVSVNWTVGDQIKGAYVYTDLSNWRGR